MREDEVERSFSPEGETWAVEGTSRMEAGPQKPTAAVEPAASLLSTIGEEHSTGLQCGGDIAGVGHVFVSKGSAAALACDAHIVTCSINADRTLNLKPRWGMDDKLPGAQRLADGIRVQCDAIDDAFLSGRVFIHRVTPWPPAGAEHELPQPYLVNVGDSAPSPALLDEFLSTIELDFDRPGKPLFHRARKLLGMVVAGATRVGDIGGAMHELLPKLESWAARTAYDIALMCGADGLLYSAVQAARVSSESEGGALGGGPRWRMLSAGLREQARALSQHVIDEDLVLFVGTGHNYRQAMPTQATTTSAMTIQAISTMAMTTQAITMQAITT